MLMGGANDAPSAEFDWPHDKQAVAGYTGAKERSWHRQCPGHESHRLPALRVLRCKVLRGTFRFLASQHRQIEKSPGVNRMSEPNWTDVFEPETLKGTIGEHIPPRKF